MEPVVINIHFWQVKEPDGGYNGITFQDEKLLESVAFLNKHYNQHKFFFKYTGYSSFNSPEHPWFIREAVQVDYDANGDGVIDENDVVFECNEQIENHKVYFQPGFDYIFIRCEGDYPLPAPYGEDFSFYPNDELLRINKDIPIEDYETINHPNHSAILIYQVDVALDYSNAQKCYNNYNRNAKGGNVIRFNDNVLNYNITTTPKDSTSINNQNLINTLENGLYKIEKEFDDGTTQETIIQKGNN